MDHVVEKLRLIGDERVEGKSPFIFETHEILLSIRFTTRVEYVDVHNCTVMYSRNYSDLWIRNGTNRNRYINNYYIIYLHL